MILAIFNAIAAIPSLLSAIESMIAFFSDQVDQAKKRKLAADLAAAAEIAKQKKDTSGLDNIFDPGKKK